MKCFLLLTTLIPLFLSAQPTLRFAVTGDTPYKKEEEIKLLRDIKRNNKHGNTGFLIHVGDILSSGCKEEQYRQVAEILKVSEIPVLVIPGDNEWNDCADPAQAWEYWSKYFAAFEQHFNTPFLVERQPGHEANFAFVFRNVLVVGLNNVGGRIHDTLEWKQRLKNNNEWLGLQFDRHGATVQAALVFGHAMPMLFGYKEKFVEHCRFFDKPVAYIQGDDHAFLYQQGWHAPNITRVIVDQGGLTEGLTTGAVTPHCDVSFEIARNGAEPANRCLDLALYPLPAMDYLYLELGNIARGKVTFTIFDNKGRVAVSFGRTQETGSILEKIAINGLSPGIYFLQVSTPDQHITRRFIKF